MKNSIWVRALLIVAFLMALSVRVFHRSPDIDVTTAAVTHGPIVRRIVATGDLQPVSTVDVGAQVSGTIQFLYADYNSIVHAGDVIARLDPALFKAALGEAEAALSRAQAAQAQAQADTAGLEAAVEDAQTKLARAEELAARQLIPQSDLDAARNAVGDANAQLQAGESQIDEARAAVDEAKARVDQAKIDLDRTVITSPIDGIVVARNVDVGQTVAATVQAPVLFNIAADLKHMRVEVDVDEADIGGVQPGETATFEMESYPDRTFDGTVSQIRLQPVAEQTITATTAGTSTSPPTTTAVATVVSYATIVDVSNPDERLRPGMTATVTLGGPRREDAVRIPSTALSFRPSPDLLNAIGQSDDGLSIPAEKAADGTRREVWQFDGTRFNPIQVQVGLMDVQWTELVSGPLHPGEALVTSALISPAPGARESPRATP